MTHLKRLLITVAVVTAVAVTAAQDRAPVVPGIDVAGMDLSVRPQDDFFRYVNGRWADNTPIPADRSSYGTFGILGERSQEAVRAIIEDQARGNAAAGTINQKVGDLYKSFMDEAKLESLGITPLKAELDAIAKISNSSELPAAFARAARAGVRLPFTVGVGADQRNSEQYAVSVSQSGLGMPDRDYYLRNDETVRGHAQGLHHLHRQAVRARQSARSRRRRRAHRLARDQARRAAVGSRAQSRSQRHLQQDGASARCRLDAALRLAGLPGGQPAGAKDKVSEVIVRQPDYLKAVDALIAEAPRRDVEGIPDVRLDQRIRRRAVGAVRRRAVRVQRQGDRRPPGAAAAMEARRHGSRAGARRAGRPLYVERHFKPEAKARDGRAHPEPARRVQASASTSSSGCAATPRPRRRPSWRSSRVKIGYPDQWRDYSALEIKPGDLVGNAAALPRVPDDGHRGRASASRSNAGAGA